MATKSLRRASEFQRVFRDGKSAAGQYVVVYAVPNRLTVVRLGFPVGKKFGGAVKRNRIKRMLREAARLAQNMPCRGYDMVIVPRRKMLDPNLRCHKVMGDLEKVLHRLSLETDSDCRANCSGSDG